MKEFTCPVCRIHFASGDENMVYCSADCEILDVPTENKVAQLLSENVIFLNNGHWNNSQ